MEGMSETVFFLKTLIEIANEILDFDSHLVVMLGQGGKGFGGIWNFLSGKLNSTQKKLTYPQKKALQGILSAKSPRISIPACVKHNKQIASKCLVAPLHMGYTPLGSLILEPLLEFSFTDYDIYLVKCLTEILALSSAPDCERDIISPLQFCLLHRRHFLAATPDIDEVLGEYLNRIVEQQEFPVLSPEVNAVGNIRLITPIGDQSSSLKLEFRKFAPELDKATRRRAVDHTLVTTKSKVKAWIDLWSQCKDKPPPDIDPEYRQLFRNALSHISIPCYYKSNLYGIFSIDSPHRKAFNKLDCQALCILAAQAAPVIANAWARTQLRKERTYFQVVLDAIPDEVLIIDENAQILMMNKAKRTRFPKAKPGQYCYEAFEYGEKSACSGCHTLASIKSGKPITKALWQYKHPDTGKTGYAEISAGPIGMVGKGPRQAVEVVRNVDAREVLLTWMESLQHRMFQVFRERIADLEKNESLLTDWLWKYLGTCLRNMDIGRCRIYTYKSGRFFGNFIFPRSAFQGKDFTKFFLDCRYDLPSKISLKDTRLRPVRFVIDKSQKRNWRIPREESEWNYLTCYLRKVPTKCAKYLGKEQVQSWIDIPVGTIDHVYGKLSVDAGSSDDSAVTQRETAYEMSLFASLGRFASIAMQVAEQYTRLASLQKREAILEFAGDVEHELTHCNLASNMGISYIQRKLPVFLKECVHVSGSSEVSSVVKQTYRLWDRMFEADLRLPIRLSASQKALTRRIAHEADKSGVECSSEDAVVFILSSTDSSILQLLKLARTNEEIAALEHVVVLGNVLSRLQTLPEIQRTFAGLQQSLLVSSILAQPSPVSVDIQESLHAAIRVVLSFIPSTLEILLKRSVPSLPAIASHGESLRILWVNLLTNAAEAMNKKGTITLVVNRRGQSVAIRISDQGRGLSKKMVSFIHDLQPVKGMAKRTNRGLRIVKRIVAAHGGDIRVISTCKKGTTLEVKIPLKGVEK
jgi:signal transduction histidine kinase/PAS domain-containing protein